MKTYTCVCGQLIFFQNVSCVNCHRDLGFLPDLLWLTSLDPAENGLWRPTAEIANGKLYKKCQDYTQEGVCNWMIPESQSDEIFCASCRLNEMIPDLSEEPNRDLWARIESAKRRLMYSLIDMKLPIAGKRADPQCGLAFRFLSDLVRPDGSTSRVMTGHEQGVITLNIAEADDSTREKIRNAMHEPYRTLLGHLRHESGHYYWDRLVRGTEFLEPFRRLFGDEQDDYQQALQRHYDSGAPANWQENFISMYATTHPWEDWAETWAHFLHIQDTLEVANDFGLAGKRLLMNPQTKDGKTALSSKQTTFEEVIQSWSELAVALNSINRSMGFADLYPFVLSPAVVAKLEFVYQVIVAPRRSDAPIEDAAKSTAPGQAVDTVRA
jgi:hypothetical protein